MKRLKNWFVFALAAVAFLTPLKSGTPVMIQSPRAAFAPAAASIALEPGSWYIAISAAGPPLRRPRTL